METHTAPLQNLLYACAPAAGRAWIDEALQRVRAEPDTLPRFFPAASRKLGRSPLADNDTALATEYGPLRLHSWCIDDAGRALLLLATGAAAQQYANRLYASGELRERIGCLRCLALLPGADVARPSLEDACRTNSVSLFEAAVCENPYASHWLEPLLFNQSVLKAAFMDVRLTRIERLDERASFELSRMLTSYVSERLAAGRSVPYDVWPTIARHPQPSTWEHLQAFAADPFAGHRFHVARALKHLTASAGALAESARALLASRREVESEARVLAELDQP